VFVLSVGGGGGVSQLLCRAASLLVPWAHRAVSAILLLCFMTSLVSCSLAPDPSYVTPWAACLKRHTIEWSSVPLYLRRRAWAHVNFSLELPVIAALCSAVSEIKVWACVAE
jgi:hypothetical protein